LEASGLARISAIMFIGTVLLIWVPTGMALGSLRRLYTMPFARRWGSEPKPLAVSTRIKEP